MSLTLMVVLTGLFVLAVSACGALIFFHREDQSREILKESIAAGLNQPASMHPVVNHDVCMSSGACVDACPEQVLGIIDGVTKLVKAGECIGHGRCREACPTHAIALVFGTAERGVDIPLLRPGYETNVDGIFIIGELGGMGLIRNAMRQGMQCITSLKDALSRPGLETDDDSVDVIIVGSGPAGMAAAVKCVEQELSFELLEQYALGGSVMHYPRRKLVFTEVIKLPIVGRFGKTEMLKEELVAEFERVALAAGIEVREGMRVTSVKGELGRFVVTVEGPGGESKSFKGKSVVLAIGRRGTPRKIGCPGEDLPHVVYRLQDAEQFRHRKVLVVGGGDSAVEAAISLAQVAGTEVHLSYRGDSFYRVKKKNREDVQVELESGRIVGHLESNVVEIGRDHVKLKDKTGRVQRLAIDDVIVNIGGVLPTAFLESMGVKVETKRGEKIDLGESSARVIAERITARLSKAADVSTTFARPVGDFVKTASQRITGRTSGEKKRPTRRTGRLGDSARKRSNETTDELTPFGESDKQLPPATRPDRDKPTGGTTDELTPYLGSDDRVDPDSSAG